MEILNKIVELKKKSFNITNSESLDDLKEHESYDFEIITLIYDYCLTKNYNIEGFPEQYLELIANDDEDFYDFLSFDVMYYYTLKNALIHNDVFLLIEAFFNSPKEDNYTNENCKSDILLEIQLLEIENINLTFNRADYNTSNFWGKDRPKLP